MILFYHGVLRESSRKRLRSKHVFTTMKKITQTTQWKLNTQRVVWQEFPWIQTEIYSKNVQKIDQIGRSRFYFIIIILVVMCIKYRVLWALPQTWKKLHKLHNRKNKNHNDSEIYHLTALWTIENLEIDRISNDDISELKRS